MSWHRSRAARVLLAGLVIVLAAVVAAVVGLQATTLTANPTSAADQDAERAYGEARRAFLDDSSGRFTGGATTPKAPGAEDLLAVSGRWASVIGLSVMESSGPPEAFYGARRVLVLIYGKVFLRVLGPRGSGSCWMGAIDDRAPEGLQDFAEGELVDPLRVLTEATEIVAGPTADTLRGDAPLVSVLSALPRTVSETLGPALASATAPVTIRIEDRAFASWSIEGRDLLEAMQGVSAEVPPDYSHLDGLTWEVRLRPAEQVVAPPFGPIVDFPDHSLAELPARCGRLSAG